MMNKVKGQYKSQGFTLIELILVILILGIMATTVIPKMTTNEGYAERGYINEVVTALRAIQLRSMQNTNDSTCANVIVASKSLSNNSNCDLWESGGTSVEISENEVSFDLTQDTIFGFDSLGRPINCDASPCLVVIKGREGDLTVQIESEGFIHVL